MAAAPWILFVSHFHTRSWTMRGKRCKESDHEGKRFWSRSEEGGALHFLWHFEPFVHHIDLRFLQICIHWNAELLSNNCLPGRSLSGHGFPDYPSSKPMWLTDRNLNPIDLNSLCNNCVGLPLEIRAIHWHCWIWATRIFILLRMLQLKIPRKCYLHNTYHLLPLLNVLLQNLPCTWFRVLQLNTGQKCLLRFCLDYLSDQGKDVFIVIHPSSKSSAALQASNSDPSTCGYFLHVWSPGSDQEWRAPQHYRAQSTFHHLHLCFSTEQLLNGLFSAFRDKWRHVFDCYLTSSPTTS